MDDRAELIQNWKCTEQRCECNTWRRHEQPNQCETSHLDRDGRSWLIKVIRVKNLLRLIFFFFFLSKWKQPFFKDYVQVWKWRGWEVAKEACTVCIDKTAASGICNFNACALLIIWLFKRLSRKKHNDSLGLVWRVGGAVLCIHLMLCGLLSFVLQVGRETMSRPTPIWAGTSLFLC